MRINMSSVQKKDTTASIKLNYSADDREKEDYLGLLGATKVDSVEIGGEICQKNGLVAVDYTIEAEFLAECARCGKEFWHTITIGGEKYIADKSGEDDAGGDFYVTETEGIFDTSDFITEFLGLEVPYRYLCREECMGLCRKCGADLNEGTCKCDKKEKNPAFDILDEFYV